MKEYKKVAITAELAKYQILLKLVNKSSNKLIGNLGELSSIAFLKVKESLSAKMKLELFHAVDGNFMCFISAMTDGDENSCKHCPMNMEVTQCMAEHGAVLELNALINNGEVADRDKVKRLIEEHMEMLAEVKRRYTTLGKIRYTFNNIYNTMIAQTDDGDKEYTPPDEDEYDPKEGDVPFDDIPGERKDDWTPFEDHTPQRPSDGPKDSCVEGSCGMRITPTEYQ